jgi:hypothetical protein
LLPLSALEQTAVEPHCNHAKHIRSGSAETSSHACHSEADFQVIWFREEVFVGGEVFGYLNINYAAIVVPANPRFAGGCSLPGMVLGFLAEALGPFIRDRASREPCEGA